MKKKLICTVLIAIMFVSTMMIGCSNKKEPSTQTTHDNSVAVNTEDISDSVATNSVRAFEDIVFPDVIPTSYTSTTEADYVYDDMTKHYEVSILTHNYGGAGNADSDVIRKYLEDKFNVTIKMETVTQTDMETTLSTRAAGNDLPDIFWAYNDSFAKELASQGLLVDAREFYRYMPQTTQFTTKGMIEWSKVEGTDELPFITKYGIQDGVWGFAIRKDWLEKFGMDIPKTKQQLLDYAVACTTQDPDGNGKADTWFMTGAGGGAGWGMLAEFANMFGNPSARVENGELVHPLFDDSTKEYYQFLNELNELNVLAPDWFTIDWEKAKSYTLNDKIGMVHYPAGSLALEYTQVHNDNIALTQTIWEFLQEAPIEGGKYGAAGNPGYCWSFTKNGFEDEGKIKRIAHMLDTMVMGGENFFETIQSSTTDVFKAYGIEADPMSYGYNDNGTFYIYREPSSQFWKDATSNSTDYGCLGPWQEFGLNVAWQRDYEQVEDPTEAEYNAYKNEQADNILGLDRWPNDGLLSAVPAGSIAPELGDFDLRCAYEFITGVRSFNDWESYQQEWLNMGGRKVIKAIAEKLGCPVPTYAN